MDDKIRNLMPGELEYKLFTGEKEGDAEFEWDNWPTTEERGLGAVSSHLQLKSKIEKVTQYVTGLLSGKSFEKRHIMLESKRDIASIIRTALKNVVANCIKQSRVNSPMLHFTVTDYCGVESLYRLISSVGYRFGFVKESADLERYESNEKQKNKAATEIIKKIKVIFVADSHVMGAEIWNTLLNIIETGKIETFLVGTRSIPFMAFMSDYRLKVFGTENEEYDELHSLIVKEEDFMMSLVTRNKSTAQNEAWQQLSYLTQEEQYMLLQISSCRKPLPIPNDIKLKKFTRTFLVEVMGGESYITVKVPLSSKEILKEICYGKSFEMKDESKKELRAIELWKSLLHPKLKKLLSGAEQQKWPYVPEPWQFTDNVNEEDSYNLRDLLNKNNEYCTVVPMREVDILQECLYHALKDKDYKEASAVAFLIDRYAFWKGDSSALMAIVDFIMKVSPETAIAPQIITRKARVKKNEGDLQGAGKILDELIDDEKKAGNWYYRDHAEYLIIKAASIELKGNIFHGLGLWYEAAASFMDSTGLFRSFQKPDKKGLAAGLALLADTLQFMPADDFKQFSRSFQLPTDHPLLESIRSVTEAAKYCVHTPLFYAKNKRRAAEFSLAYARYLDAQKAKEEEKWPYLRNAAFEILEGMKCHTSINRLESREQYFEFVACVYRISQICRQLFKGNKNKSAEIFEKLASDLFQHYCSYPIKVKHNEKTIALINKVMNILQLPELPETDKLMVSGVPSVKINVESAGDSDNAKLMAIGEELESEDASSLNESEAGPSIYNEGAAEQIHTSMKSHSTVSSTLDTDTNPTVPEISIKNEATVISTAGTTETNERQTQDVGTRNRSTLTSVEALLESAGDAEEHFRFREAETLITNESVESNDTGYRSASTASTQEGLQQQTKDRQVKSKLLKCYTAAEGETVEERNWRVESTAGTLEDIGTSNRILEEVKKQRMHGIGKNGVQKAVVWRYDPISKEWNTTETLACVGDMLDFGEKEGACRDAYNFEHLNQDDPYGKYVGKQYKLTKYKNNPKSLQQYKEDIICQNTARYYVTMFNQRLYDKIKDQTFSQIQFLPAVLVELIDVENDPEKYFNVEPFMFGNFEKITNNTDHVTEKDVSEKDLLLAFSHFTYFASSGELLVVDIQGWTSQDKKGFHYLTDPQIHTRDEHYTRYGTGNLGQRGFDNFWSKQHRSCNDICKVLGLRRPFNLQ